MKTKSVTALFVLVGIAGPLAVGCSEAKPAESLDVSRASLRRVQSCGELTQALRDDARSKMNRRIDAEIRAIREGYSSGTGGGAFGGAPMEAPAALPSAGAAAGDSRAADTSPPAHSDTETQVKGVDEADIVKADGTRLYVLHGQKLLLVNAWPAATLAQAGSVDIEGTPSEMFVADGKVVVFSNVDGAPVYAASGVAPRPGYSDAYAMSGSGGGMAGTRDMVPSPGSGYSASYANPLTKVTVLVLEGDGARVAREMYFEGAYLSSRRVGAKVRVVLQGGAHGPTLDYTPKPPARVALTGQPYSPPSTSESIAAYEALRTTNEAAISASSFGDWIPARFAKQGTSVQAQPIACEDFYVPNAGTDEFGITQIQAFDLDAPEKAPRAAAIVGQVDAVYGDTSSMVLAGRAYVDPWIIRSAYGAPVARSSSGATAPGGATPAPLPVVTMNYSRIHLFDLAGDPDVPVYTGTGTVPGSVTDQFSLDQKDGRVRVTTTEQRSGGSAPSDGRQNEVSHVFVLQNEAGNLAIHGDAGEIAPGEQLYATRYIGDKAYVVTWHVTDPLFVVDLADPAHPTVLGQLQIPGFSEYMHPLDDTHLLTIGRETDMTGHQHTNGGYWYGIAIQIFDVTDPLHPTLQQKYVYDGGEYATTEAATNHKAFTYFDDKKLLAFPYVRQAGWGASTGSAPSSTLEIFHVDVPNGINKLGSVDHASLLGKLPNGQFGYCGGMFDGEIRRGVFFENVVYSVSYGGIEANDVGQLANAPLGTLKLEAPTAAGVCAAPGGA
jgi:hypothetical protein